jgi:uncharacterized protein (TIGR04141 family)
MGAKTNKLTIYLIKPEFNRWAQIVEDSAQPHDIDSVGTLYTEASRPRAPDWVQDFFVDTFPTTRRLITSSAKAVLLVRIRSTDASHIFAVTFGYGRSLLKDGVIEDRFGLKVVLNAVDPQSLRSIDKTALGSVPKQSREQMSRASAAATFGIDIEQDLVNAVTGRSRDPQLGKTISGRDALSVSVKVDVTDIKEFLRACLAQYESNAYKTNFGWIDQIRDLRDPKTVADLDAILITRLRKNNLGKIWMAVPEIVDWVDVKGFRYARRKRADLKADLDVGEFLASLDGDEEITVDLLKTTPIYVVSSRSDQAFDHWSSYKCLYAEIERGDKLFVLNNGRWYEIDKAFTAQVAQEFKRIPESSIVLPEYAHADEGAYNASLPAAITDSYCMDQKMIDHGGGHSKIEFCDLATADKKLVHIKRYSGSTQLSHLFAQGVVSGELFLQDEAFRRKVNEKLPRALRLPDIRKRPNPAEYEIVYGIISRSSNPLEIPFFSKVNLRNAQRRLQAYGYKVTKKKIQAHH